jgi:hypothetical protein
MKRTAILFNIVFPGIMSCLFAGCGSAPNVVTMAEYSQVQNGMTYQQVLSVIGQTGEEVSSAAAPGTTGGTVSETQTYQWKNPDGSSMTVIFWNKKLMGKAQHGLK